MYERKNQLFINFLLGKKNHNMIIKQYGSSFQYSEVTVLVIWV